jgi:8-oxo-dGTP pyrophosphatase MutT (NUDIX family)
MHICYARDPFPDPISCTLYLMGPTPRTPDLATTSWRKEALAILQESGFQGEVFVPEPRDGRWGDDYTDQLAWEDEALHRSDCILVWLPRDMATLPGLTTNDEWGYWKGRDPARLIFGVPPEATNVRYQEHYARQLGIPVFSTLTEACAAGMKVGRALRHGGECQVPLHVWRTTAFQRWYAAQKQAGNILRGARVDWVYRLDNGSIFYWALRADLFVAAESRTKSNEVVLARPDIAAVVLYRPGPGLLETEVVLVREFRSSGRTRDGFILELPSGSTFPDEQDLATVARNEVEQETGVRLDAATVHRHQARQLVGPLATHQAAVFSAELGDAAMDEIRIREGSKTCCGMAAETEQTYPCVRTVRQLLNDSGVDWSTLGMILAILQERLRVT